MDMNRYFDKLFETDQIAIQTIMNELVELQEKISSQDGKNHVQIEHDLKAIKKHSERLYDVCDIALRQLEMIFK